MWPRKKYYGKILPRCSTDLKYLKMFSMLQEKPSIFIREYHFDFSGEPFIHFCHLFTPRKRQSPPTHPPPKKLPYFTTIGHLQINTLKCFRGPPLISHPNIHKFWHNTVGERKGVKLVACYHGDRCPRKGRLSSLWSVDDYLVEVLIERPICTLDVAHRGKVSEHQTAVVKDQKLTL